MDIPLPPPHHVAGVSSHYGKIISYNILYDILLNYFIINCNPKLAVELYKQVCFHNFPYYLLIYRTLVTKYLLYYGFIHHKI